MSDLTSSELASIRRKCNDRMNWSDGGHWIGSGEAPNCFVKRVVTGGLARVTLIFEDHHAAREFNAKMNELATHNARGATAIGIGVGVITAFLSPKVSIPIGIAVGVGLNKFLEDSAVPPVMPGYKFRTETRQQVVQTAHPWNRGQSGFTMWHTNEMFDERGTSVVRRANNTFIEEGSFRGDELMEAFIKGMREHDIVATIVLSKHGAAPKSGSE